MHLRSVLNVDGAGWHSFGLKFKTTSSTLQYWSKAKYTSLVAAMWRLMTSSVNVNNSLMGYIMTCQREVPCQMSNTSEYLLGKSLAVVINKLMERPTSASVSFHYWWRSMAWIVRRVERCMFILTAEIICSHLQNGRHQIWLLTQIKLAWVKSSFESVLSNSLAWSINIRCFFLSLVPDS